MKQAIADGPGALEAKLVPGSSWTRFPVSGDRAAWRAIDPQISDELLARGERALEMPWDALPATLLLDFARTGDRESYQNPDSRRRGELRDLVLAECVEGEGRFLDEIANGVWLVCEQSTWVLPAHLFMQAAGSGLPEVADPIVDLGAGEVAALLAWTDHLVGEGLDTVSPLLRKRILHEVNTRVLDPYLTRDDLWWAGFKPGEVMNNWNPWVNSNILTATLLLEHEPARRAAIAHKVLRSLDHYLHDMPADGGCDEGAAYWNRAAASLFDCLELIEAATGSALDYSGEAYLQRAARYPLAMHIGGPWFVNFADGPPRPSVDAPLLWRYGRWVGDDEIASGAVALSDGDLGTMIRKSAYGSSMGRLLPLVFDARDFAATPAKAPLWRDVWYEDLQVAAARDEAGSTDGWFVAIKGGHNAESHNHNDLGNFVIARDGRFVVVDAGVGVYTRQTFGEDRYSIWTMQSAWHNVPTVNGFMQAPGREFEARVLSREVSDGQMRVVLDLAAAYPVEPAIRDWERSLTFERGHSVRVVDRFELEHVSGATQWHYLVGQKPKELGKGRLGLAAVGEDAVVAEMLFDGDAFEVSIERRELEDSRLRGAWGEALHRITITPRDEMAGGTFSVVFRPVD